MKTILNFLTLLLLVVSISSCKTKEKITEKLSETARSNSSSIVMKSKHTGQQGQSSMKEETTQTSWSDSIVERYHERIVQDSTGRVLLHEQEHTKDHYKGQTQSQTNRNGNSQATAAGQKTELTVECNDSTYNGNRLNKVTFVKKKSWRWLWYMVLLGSLLTAGVIISKVIRE